MVVGGEEGGQVWARKGLFKCPLRRGEGIILNIEFLSATTEFSCLFSYLIILFMKSGETVNANGGNSDEALNTSF